MGRLKVRLTEGSNVRVPWCSGRTLEGSMVADLRCQFARVVKGVDLRSTAGNCAWARTPQLTHLPAGCLASHCRWKHLQHLAFYAQPKPDEAGPAHTTHAGERGGG